GFKSVTWNYTEASHGKGAPDGVGGALKNLADRLVAYGTDIPDAEALLHNLSKQSSVKLSKVTEEKVETYRELVPPSLKTVQGTRKVHQLVSTDAENAASEEKAEESIEVGQWVLVEYDGDLYPGTVIQIVEDQFEVVNCAGENRFFYPSIGFPGDKVWYFRDNIKDMIPEPMPATSSARHFSVTAEILLPSSRVLWLTSPSPSFLDSTGICQDCSSCTKHERRDTTIHSLLESLDSENSNQNRRSAALLGLPYFMKEDPSNFIKFCEATDSEEAAAVNGVDVGILIVTEEREPAALPKNIADVAVILEGRIVLRKLRDLPTGFAVLMGILYSLNIDYPKGLKDTFEVIQKVIMDIGGGTCSARAHGLRNKWLQGTI
ncbi:hypothetical protein KUCAC02_001941, partial [Chaenocephalus aceratus]